MIFTTITERKANLFATLTDLEFTPCHNDQYRYYYYTENQILIPGTVELTESEMLGLTPINPNKPMFPKK